MARLGRARRLVEARAGSSQLSLAPRTTNQPAVVREIGAE
jgi:hypothetical protein